MSLQQRLQESPVVEAKTEGERLYLRFQELKSVERQVEAELKAIRPEIDQLMADGELVGFTDAHLSLQERTNLSVDMDALITDLGEKIALRCSDISAAKLRKMIEAGVVPETAPYIQKTVTKSLVTTTNRK